MTATARACADCGDNTGAPGRMYCDECRWKHRRRRPKWVFTPERDALLRERYNSHVRGRTAEIAAVLEMPAWAVKRRAGELGLTRPDPSHRPWTAAEVEFLEDHLGRRNLTWLMRRLKRTRASVALKIKHLGLSRKWRDGYTMRDLETALGTDHRQIRRWVDSGLLQGRKRCAEATDSYGWHFTDRDVLHFVREHRSAFRLDRVDQLWFLDLVFAHKRALNEEAA